MNAYYFEVVFTIDAFGTLILNDTDKFSLDSPGPDLICFRALQDVLHETQWVPAFETKKKSNIRTAIPTTGWAFIMITSKGFESIEMADGTTYRETFYKCNLGK